MFGTEHLALFIVSGFLLNITPGQDTLYIVGRTVSQGRRAGVLSVLGISSGCVVHTIAAAYGLAAGIGGWVGHRGEGVIVLPALELRNRYDKLPAPSREPLA